jgi:hypothetical protein
LNKRISLFVLIILTLSLFGSSPKPVHAQTGWWNSNWKYRITIEIDRTKIEDDFVDFPVLIVLNSTNINWAHVQDDLDDLRFIDGDEITQLYAELENYTVNVNAWIWVKIPNIYSMGIPEFNQAFYLYYGNPSVSSWWSPENVWDSSAVMVQHMVDLPDNTRIMDSTSYDNDGIKHDWHHPIETTLGKIDSAQDFEGIHSHIDISHSSSLDGFSALVIDFWMRPTSFGYPTNWINIIAKGYGGNGGFLIYFEKTVNGRLAFELRDDGGNWIGIYNAPPLPSLNVWYHCVFIYKIGIPLAMYVNGSLLKSGPTPTTTLTNNQLLSLSFYSFKGIMDEVRIYKNVTISPQWIIADFNSGADTLLIYGVESLCPLALTICYNTGINKLYINNMQIANNTTIYIDKNTNVNATTTLKSDFIFMKYMLGSTGASLTPTYIFNMTNPFTLWSYATPNFFIYEEPTTFTFTHWLILLFLALGISLLAAIKFHIIAMVSLILVLYMIINVASYTGMILLAIIIWLLTIMFSIIAFGEI